jgi:ATP-dependent DNA helicase Rep
MKLNPQQRAAVEYCDGPLLVLAGAGSGKTRVIAEKIAYLVRRKNLTPGKVAAITFTNKAAREMRERAARLLKGEAADELNVCTFHALGCASCRSNMPSSGSSAAFPCSTPTTARRSSRTWRRRRRSPIVLFALRNLLSQAKNAGLDPDQAAPRREARASARRRICMRITRSASERSTPSTSTT